jgi:hypothetical protein
MSKIIVDAQLRSILSRADFWVDGAIWHLTLPTRLDPIEFKQFRRVIRSLHGNWNRTTKTWVFMDDPTEVLGEAAEEDPRAPPRPTLRMPLRFRSVSTR